MEILSLCVCDSVQVVIQEGSGVGAVWSSKLLVTGGGGEGRGGERMVRAPHIRAPRVLGQTSGRGEGRAGRWSSWSGACGGQTNPRAS